MTSDREEVGAFETQAEAMVAVSFLQSFDIDAVFADRPVQGLPANVFRKGYRITAPAFQAAEARQLLADAAAGSELAEEDE